MSSASCDTKLNLQIQENSQLKKINRIQKNQIQTLPAKPQTLLGSTAPTHVDGIPSNDDLKPPKLKRHDGLDRRIDLEGRLQKLEKSKLDLEKRVAYFERLENIRRETLDGFEKTMNLNRAIIKEHGEILGMMAPRLVKIETTVEKLKF
tara:strand:+ start:80 stop:526 length:447 start_codon:yes stop_codon:yes gene_type:complete